MFSNLHGADVLYVGKGFTIILETVVTLESNCTWTGISNLNVYQKARMVFL